MLPRTTFSPRDRVGGSGVLGLSLAYFGFRHDLPLTIRSGLYPLLGRRTDGWITLRFPDHAVASDVLRRAQGPVVLTAAGMGHIVVMDDSPAQLALTRWSP